MRFQKLEDLTRQGKYAVAANIERLIDALWRHQS